MSVGAPESASPCPPGLFEVVPFTCLMNLRAMPAMEMGVCSTSCVVRW
jgi:hypothetical protein